ncbi:MAG: MbcA/ParS/Xre antitoxin family protein [Pseudomonadota bacterium]
MSLALGYPSTRFAPVSMIDLSLKTERERLTPTALKGFYRLIAAWSIRDEEARELLGGVSSSAFYEWKKTHPRALDVDRITRVSYLVGIYKALHILYGDDLADRWIVMPNTNAIFGGRTPLAFMLGGGIPAMQTVRRLLDARRGGV